MTQIINLINFREIKLHDAGYDAFATGMIFNALINFIKYSQNKKKKNNRAEKEAYGRAKLDDVIIAQFVNQINPIMDDIQPGKSCKLDHVICFRLNHLEDERVLKEILLPFGTFELTYESPFLGFVEFFETSLF